MHACMRTFTINPKLLNHTVHPKTVTLNQVRTHFCIQVHLNPKLQTRNLKPKTRCARIWAIKSNRKRGANQANRQQSCNVQRLFNLDWSKSGSGFRHSVFTYALGTAWCQGISQYAKFKKGQLPLTPKRQTVSPQKKFVSA